MGFGANKTPVEIIKEGAFGGTYFRDNYSDIKKLLIKSIIAQIIMLLVLTNVVLNVEHH